MPEISAKHRTEIGKHLNSLRRAGVLPAVLYGEGVAATPLSVSVKDFGRVFSEAGETGLVSLSVEGKTYNVLVYDIASDPLTSEPVHVDFYAVRMDKPIEAKVPLVFTGESAAVRNEGGIIVKVLHELEVKALPKDLPHEIVVDIGTLEKIGDKIHVAGVALPGGVAALSGAEEVVALVLPPRAEAELEAVAKPAEAEAVAEVKTEREAKAEAKEAEVKSEAAAEGK
ncbi:MAG: hypothetical protein A3B37_01915 [Candidatus Sungbacteria bacterium RIFCSPLOWO2_01_FULL_59_16]|uniref:Large ribosomal subunit protein bL25 n=1 Tax=Candidatus Sungbacteria bacterium RIFCSPLOWO2_01_FULL_59_16 TaxID=1802280 RepID=A0A1G2LAN0_9BACT|nr:MAG: hypothetical protein A3B37_01915 [Candidatus Sungbacteria bacterium RIFCSPLOWO2_01_FULL_59_16]